MFMTGPGPTGARVRYKLRSSTRRPLLEVGRASSIRYNYYMGKVDYKSRAHSINKLYQSGMTLQQVADKYGLTRERVRQILRKEGYPVRSKAQAAAVVRSRAESQAEPIMNLYRELGDAKAVAEQLGFSQSSVKAILKANLPPDLRPASQKRSNSLGPARKRYTDQELIDCLKSAASGCEGLLSASRYDLWAAGRSYPDGRPFPGHQAPSLRFGSWALAASAAGLQANPSSPIKGHLRFDNACCMKAIADCAKQCGQAPTCAEYSRFAKASADCPSLATVRHRYGSWLKALAAAGF